MFRRAQHEGASGNRKKAGGYVYTVHSGRWHMIITRLDRPRLQSFTCPKVGTFVSRSSGPARRHRRLRHQRCRAPHSAPRLQQLDQGGKCKGKLRESCKGWKAAIDQWLARPASQPRLAAHQVSCTSFPHFPMEKWHCGLAWLVGGSASARGSQEDKLLKPGDLANGNGKGIDTKQINKLGSSFVFSEACFEGNETCTKSSPSPQNGTA